MALYFLDIKRQNGQSVNNISNIVKSKTKYS